MAPISLPGQLVNTRRFTLGVPGQFTVAPDARHPRLVVRRPRPAWAG